MSLTEQILCVQKEIERREKIALLSNGNVRQAWEAAILDMRAVLATLQGLVYEPVANDSVYLELRAVKPSREKTRNVLVVTLFPVARMDEGVELAELELEGAPDSLLARHLSDPADYAERMLDAALVIIGQVKYEEIAEIKLIFHE